MEKEFQRIRVLIVDDSPFSSKMIAESLDPHWFEIVGFADGFRSALDSYRTLNPDVITMDISMPQIDGLECTARIIAEEPDAKIIIVSGMKDDTLEAIAKAKGAVGYIQKPSEPEELMDTLRRACEDEIIGEQFTDRYPQVFLETFTHFLKRFLPDLTFSPLQAGVRRPLDGLAVLIGITGQFSGRMTVDLSWSTAKGLADRLLKQETKDDQEVLDVIAEVANIAAGNATSKINKEFRMAFLRVSPPGIFTGEKFFVASPSVDTHSWELATSYGEIHLSIGFKKENSKWM